MRKHGIVIYSVHKIFNPSTEHRPASSLNVNTVDTHSNLTIFAMA
jgi:hypothetical protein